MIRSYTNSELIKLMDMAPLPVQRAIESKGTVAIVTGLGTRLDLHIDQIGKIAALNVQMLLGLVSPEEFLKELIATKILEKDAREIMTEINQKIFVPLREQMRSGAETKQEPAKPVAPQASPQGAAAQPPRPLLAEVKPPQILIPPPPISQRPALRNVLAAVMKAPPAPPSLPGAMPETRPSLAIPKTEPQMQPSPKPITPAIPPAPPPKPLTSYSTDPYREPIDEK